MSVRATLIMAMLAKAAIFDSHSHRLMARLCVSLSTSGGLSSEHLHNISLFSRLTSLSITSGDIYIPDMLKFSLEPSLELPPCLTRLVNPESLEALRFPYIPAAYSSLTRLTKLNIAPTTLVAQDLESFTQLQSVEVGPLWGTLATPILLPRGQAVSLQHLNAASECWLHNLDAVTSLTHL